jgi:hypothetical protein
VVLVYLVLQQSQQRCQPGVVDLHQVDLVPASTRVLRVLVTLWLPHGQFQKPIPTNVFSMTATLPITACRTILHPLFIGTKTFVRDPSAGPRAEQHHPRMQPRPR